MNPPSTPLTPPTPLLQRLACHLFGLDRRSLVLFRWFLGATILLDMLLRLRDVTAHYTDTGILPRHGLLELSRHAADFSLYLVNGTASWTLLLFLLTTFCAIGLMIGWRTRWMTVILWLLLLSLHVRTPHITNGGDLLLRLLLFWSFFLPLGDRSNRLPRDGRLKNDFCHAMDGRRGLYVSIGTAGYIVQLCLLYLFSALFKTGPAWVNGSAVEVVLRCDLYGTSFRHLLLETPALMTAATHLTLGLERWGWLLIFFPFWTGQARMLAIFLFVCMHLGFALFLHIGLFPLICIVAWMPLIPGFVWDHWLNRDGTGGGSESTVLRPPATTARGDAGSAVPRSPDSPTSEVDAHVEDSTPRLCPALMNLIAFAAILLSIGWNVQTWHDEFKLAAPLRHTARWMHLDQKWKIFAPDPPRDDGWFILQARLENGEEVDLTTGKAMSWEKPADATARIRNHRWRKMQHNLTLQSFKNYRRWYARWLAREWNQSQSPERKLQTLRLIYMVEKTAPEGEDVTGPRVLYRFWMDEKFKPQAMEAVEWRK